MVTDWKVNLAAIWAGPGPRSLSILIAVLVSGRSGSQILEVVIDRRNGQVVGTDVECILYLVHHRELGEELKHRFSRRVSSSSEGMRSNATSQAKDQQISISLHAFSRVSPFPWSRPSGSKKHDDAYVLQH